MSCTLWASTSEGVIRSMMSGFIVAGVLCSSLQFVNKKLNSTISYNAYVQYLLFAKGFMSVTSTYPI